jgi:hypothetical protein
MYPKYSPFKAPLPRHQSTTEQRTHTLQNKTLLNKEWTQERALATLSPHHKLLEKVPHGESSMK